MLKIKLSRFGKRRQPEYRIVVNEARDKRDGQYVALLGHYAPTRSPKILTLDLKEYEAWLKKGAQPTETVANLAKRAASKNPFPAKKAKPSKKSVAKAKAEVEAKEAAKAAAKAEKEAAKVAPEAEAQTEATPTPEVTEADSPAEAAAPPEAQTEAVPETTEPTTTESKTKAAE